jgi:tol-pal system protein YbgF
VRRTARRLAAMAALAIVAAACAESPRLVRSDDLDTLRTRLDQFEHRDVQSQLEIARLRQRVAELEGELRRSRASREGDAESAPALAPAEAPPAPLEMAPPPAAIEESNLAEERETKPAAATEQAVTEAYDAALRQLRDDHPAAAESALRAFAARYPGSDLADNAWFWIGESLRVRGDLAGALEAYRTAIDRYPEGNKIPDALLELGTVLDLEGRRDAAREAWAELVRRYPDTAAAESARGRLAQP